MTNEGFADAVAITASFTALLERLGISYFVGGSVASSVHGEPRSTNDVDIAADLHLKNLDGFSGLRASASNWGADPRVIERKPRVGPEVEL